MDSIMDKKTRERIIAAAVKDFGRESQVLKTVEELAELQRALTRDLPVTAPEEAEANVCEEIADVEIMLMQMRMLYDPLEIAEWREKKLRRLAERMGMQIGEDTP